MKRSEPGGVGPPFQSRVRLIECPFPVPLRVPGSVRRVPDMCGIVGYTGAREALPVLLEGLRRLEYRGYDSSGVVLRNGTGLVVERAPGKLGALVGRLKASPLKGSTGLGHTRWAT